jgi:hypothetical protein
MKVWRLESMTGSTVLLKFTYYRMYILLDLNQHPVRQPFKSGRIYSDSIIIVGTWRPRWYSQEPGHREIVTQRRILAVGHKLW